MIAVMEATKSLTLVHLSLHDFAVLGAPFSGSANKSAIDFQNDALKLSPSPAADLWVVIRSRKVMLSVSDHKTDGEAFALPLVGDQVGMTGDQ